VLVAVANVVLYIATSLVHPEDGETAPSERSVPLYQIARCHLHPENGDKQRIVSKCTILHGVICHISSVFSTGVQKL